MPKPLPSFISVARATYRKAARACACIVVWTIGCGLPLVVPAASLPPELQMASLSNVDNGVLGTFERLVVNMEKSTDVLLHRVGLQTGTLDSFAPVVSPRVSLPARSTGVKLALNGLGGIAVVYPDIGEPYRGIFLQIIEGIEERTHSRVPSFPVGANLDLPALTDDMRRLDIRVVIALGRNGLKAATSLSRDIGIVAGAIVSAPDADARGIAVHSLAPDPSLLFDRLKLMMPTAKRVYVVYDPRQNGWLISLAQEAAKSRGLELVAMEAPDLKTATRLYQDVIVSADPKKDALWLPQDSTTVEESTVLPMILQESWNRSFVVFSSNVGHVRRGALFSLYPNNLELGRNLAGSALSRIATGHAAARAVVPLKDVLIAVNVRTATHLGLGIDVKRQSFDLVFPEQ